MKHALRLVAQGAATQRVAAQAFGLDEHPLSRIKNLNLEAKRLMDEVDLAVANKGIDLSVTMQTIGREAIRKIRGLMHGAEKEELQLKAAQDLADRNPETSKVQRHQQIAGMIDPEAAKLLAAALVEAAEIRVRMEQAGIGDGDFIHPGDQSAPIAVPPTHQLKAGEDVSQIRQMESGSGS